MTTKEKILFLEEKLNAVRRAEQEALKAFNEAIKQENGEPILGGYSEATLNRYIHKLRMKLCDEILADKG